MAETLKANSPDLNGETDPLKSDAKSESSEKNLKSQNDNKTSTDTMENGDVYISSKEITDKDNSDNKSDECDKKISDSTPKKSTDAKEVDDKNSDDESENKDELKGGSKQGEKDGTPKTPNTVDKSEASGCEDDDPKDDTTETSEKDSTTENPEEKDCENAEKDDTTVKAKEDDGAAENVEEKDTTENVEEKDTTENVEEKDTKENSEDIDAVEDEKEKKNNEKEDQTDSIKKDSKTLFSESDSSDDDSNEKWEAKNIIMYNDDEEKYYQEKKKQIQKEANKSLTCTACSKQIFTSIRSEVFTHPVLGVTICKKCTRFYGKGDFKKDEEGMDEYCRWCANGGELLLCDKCTNGFCKACVRRNLGRSALKDILNHDEWSCYVCSFEPLMNIRALHRAVIESIREKGPDSKSPSKKKETAAKESSGTIVSKKKTRSPENNMSHNEDIKGLLFLFQKELLKIEKRQKTKEKVSDLKFHRRLVRLIDLMQENFNRVKNEIEGNIKGFDDKEVSNSEESEGLQERINKLSEKVKSGSKKRGYEQLSDEEEIEDISHKKRKIDDDDNVKVIKSPAKKKRTPGKRGAKRARNKDVDDDASESDKDEVEEESQKISEKPKRLRVRSDLFSASSEKEKSKVKKMRGAGRKPKGNDEDSDIESLPSLTETKADDSDSEKNTSKRRSGRKVQTPQTSKNAGDSDDSEEDTVKRRSGRKAKTSKASKNADDSSDPEEDTAKPRFGRRASKKISPSTKGGKRTPPKGRSSKKSEESVIDLCSDSETESPAKNRKSSKQKLVTPVKQSRTRRK